MISKSPSKKNIQVSNVGIFIPREFSMISILVILASAALKVSLRYLMTSATFASLFTRQNNLLRCNIIINNSKLYNWCSPTTVGVPLMFNPMTISYGVRRHRLLSFFFVKVTDEKWRVTGKEIVQHKEEDTSKR